MRYVNVYRTMGDGPREAVESIVVLGGMDTETLRSVLLSNWATLSEGQEGAIIEVMEEDHYAQSAITALRDQVDSKDRSLQMAVSCLEQQAETLAELDAQIAKQQSILEEHQRQRAALAEIFGVDNAVNFDAAIRSIMGLV